ncbi:MAG: RNA 2',3'-cyclic phosphodiesterase [bacterium]|nr:RNA 2',3'-cyclic phosphodiesterase [bacterium]
MPRLFTGLEIPLAQSQSLMMLRGNIITARWIAPENYHVTLRFLGDVSQMQADDYMNQLDQLSIEPFDLTIKNVGHFGTKRAHALWTGLEPSKPLAQLHRAHEKCAIYIGLEPEPRKFIPHITLARLTRTRLSTIAPFLADFSGFKLDPFTVTQTALYSSKPSTGGGRYVVEELFPFEGAERGSSFSDRRIGD